MRIKLPRTLLYIFAFSLAAFSQSIIVTPKKVIYKRPKPLMDFKKSFSIARPKVRGTNPATAKKIETTISYEKVFDFNLKEEINEIQWLEEASYTVDYNKNGILSITLSIMGTGAYPSEASRPVVVDLKTGEKVTAKDVFVKLSQLAAKVKQTQAAEIKRSIVEIKKENPEEGDPAQLFENSNFTDKNLDRFSISDKGVTFGYDYGFPHVIQAWQPEGRYLFTWAQLKPFMRRGGLLEKFVR